MAHPHEYTARQLQQYDGQDEPEVFIAFRGVVYDVSDCPKWRTGMHENLHWAGQDLTEALAEAPHAEEIFSRPCVRAVGRLVLPP